MKKILIIYEQVDATVVVNLAGLRQILEKEDLRECLSRDVKKNDLQWCDICLAIRPNSIYTIEIGKAILRSKRCFITLFDDDLLNFPKGNSNRWKSKYARLCLKLSPYVICSNPSLVSQYSKISPSSKFVIVHAHVVEKDILPVVEVKDNIKIVYPAGGDHAELFETYIKPSIDKLYEKHKGRLQFCLIGVNPDIKGVKHKECITTVKHMSLQNYNQYMKDHRYDIGIAPLHDNPFCNMKYFNKYIEYSKCGIIGLYSNCLPYTYVVKNGVNGILVNNAIGDWYDALDNSITHCAELKRMVINAQNQLRKDFSKEGVQESIYKELECLSSIKQKYDSIFLKKHFINGIIFELRCLYHKFSAHLKQEGIRGTLIRIIKNIMK